MGRKSFLMLLVLLPFFLAFSQINKSAAKDKKPMPPKVGEVVPDISMLSVDQTTTYKLSDLKGKIVLVNFWASLVAPCRFENPNLVRAYSNFKNKTFVNGQGFTIYSVSLDTDVNNWKSAVKKDRLAWPYHVSDLKGYDSKAANDFGVRAMPYNFLVDGQGKVIAVNLRGNDLTKKLQELVK